MKRSVETGLRRCVRSCTSGSCVSAKSIRSISSNIFPAQGRQQISKQPLSRNTLQSSPRIAQAIRAYSTTGPSIEGTIGKGAEGVADEVARIKEQLTAPEHLNEKERQIWEMLMKELDCTELEVQDISGGCGSMYGIDVVSEKFRGLNMLKQQRLVNQVLGEEIKTWHGVQLKTRAP